jgi:hypothetical protein
MIFADVNYVCLPALADNFLQFLMQFSEKETKIIKICRFRLVFCRLRNEISPICDYIFFPSCRIKCNVAQISIYYHCCSVFLCACTFHYNNVPFVIKPFSLVFFLFRKIQLRNWKIFSQTKYLLLCFSLFAWRWASCCR